MTTTIQQNTTTERSTRELIDSLRNFPRGVIPAAVLRELISRGPSIEDELLRPLRSAIANAGKGVGSIPSECFFCFGLLLANPRFSQLTVIEQLLRLSDDDLDAAIGDLKHDGLIALLVGMAGTVDRDEVLKWMDRIMVDDSVNQWSRWSCISTLPYLVRDELLDRSAAIDQIISILQRRSSEKYDLISAASVAELKNLQAEEANSFVAECFDRNQIDDGIFNQSDWESERDKTLTFVEKINRLPELQFDIVEMVKDWASFSHISDSFDPRDEAQKVSSEDVLSRFSFRLSDTEIDQHLSAIRKSNDGSFPRATVEALSLRIEQVKEQLIAEVRSGMEKAGGPDARASNGPYLALTILIARDVPLPIELLLEILDLPEDQRMDLFGDSSYPALVVAASLCLQGDTGPIDLRIEDPQRQDIDQAELARFYYLSAYRRFLPRTKAIERLAELLQQTRDQGSILTASLVEALCLMSAVEHRSLVADAIADGVGSDIYSDTELLEMLDDPEKAQVQIENDSREHRDVIKQIEASVMFNEKALHPPRALAQPSHAQLEQPSEPSNITFGSIRNVTPKLGRNDPCHCGSGKKYKKCCLRK